MKQSWPGCWVALFGLALVGGASTSARAWEWSGSLAFEGRTFIDGEGERGQASESFSIAFEPELYHTWENGDQSFQVTLFARWDDQDDERSHVDVRELYWQKVARRWELAVGLRKVFWGVTESAHLVDVVNQTDRAEDPDGEQKLGQPMVQLTLLRNWGYLDLFVLPGFRERTFAGADGRLGLGLVDTDRARYTSPDGQDHVDWALRWSHSLGAWDLGLSYFDGTSRTPLLVAETTDDGEILVPVYEQVRQGGLDIQGTFGPWLLKLEAIDVRGGSLPFARVLGGFEVTAFDVMGRGLDIGGLLELSVDGAENRPNTTFVATRLTFNDVADTQILAGAILASEGSVVNIEASRRINNSWRVELNARGFVAITDRTALRGLREDSYLELGIIRFF